MNLFNDWWATWGSGMVPEKGEDREEHVRRVSRRAYLSAMGICSDIAASEIDAARDMILDDEH